MKVKILGEDGYTWAMAGLALSFLQPVAKMPKVAQRLVRKGEPHCKFLRQMKLWMRITGPWYWWKHMMTYNVGVDWPDFQSTSTMHKMLSRPLNHGDFEHPVDEAVLESVNRYIFTKDIVAASNHLPGGFLYTRILCMNYSALRLIIKQRKAHKLPEWAVFIEQILNQVKYPEFLPRKK